MMMKVETGVLTGGRLMAGLKVRLWETMAPMRATALVVVAVVQHSVDCASKQQRAGTVGL